MAVRLADGHFHLQETGLLTHGSVVQVPGDPSNGQLNPVGVKFMMDNLYSAFFVN